MDARVKSAERTADTASSPIAGYDEMNAEEISERLQRIALILTHTSHACTND